MILSHSGWRGIFAVQGGEEGRTGKISAEHRIIAAGAAASFADYLRGRGNDQPMALVGCDTRPTGKAIVEAMIPALEERGCRVCFAGIVAAPEIMAWARSVGNCGFVYVSASHNPIGHNGFKFGLADGGVLSADETNKLTENFRTLMTDSAGIARLEKFMVGEPAALPEMSAAEPAVWPDYPDYKKEALDAYSRFSGEVAWNNNNGIAEALKRGITEQPLGVCCDFNGSARCVSIDREFFNGLRIQFAAINAEPGAIVHRIVPEGESLEPCRAFLEEQHRRDPSFVMGYVPDCDGDRGNLVIWDSGLRQARALEAQEVFALACVAELAQLAWTGAPRGGKTAVVVNDPTSLRIDRVAEAFGAAVFHAEVGEANVVGLARKLRENGYTVRILGEGSAGGNITHPSAVRDPLHTVLALAKLLSLRSTDGAPGLFELWCGASGRPGRYHPDFDLADVIASLPPFATTGAYSPEAVLNVINTDHGALKSRYQKIFLREWEERSPELKARYGIHRWEAAAYNGMEERKNLTDFGEAGKGGLKIYLYDVQNKAIAWIWMRGSATEPVFRVMADASDRSIERDLIDWQRRMVMEADRQEN